MIHLKSSKKSEQPAHTQKTISNGSLTIEIKDGSIEQPQSTISPKINNTQPQKIKGNLNQQQVYQQWKRLSERIWENLDEQKNDKSQIRHSQNQHQYTSPYQHQKLQQQISSPLALNDSLLTCRQVSMGNKEPHANKIKKIIHKLSIQLKQLKRFIQKQIVYKTNEMYQIFRQGNKKSIDLVMLIVKQLQKQNQQLRTKLYQYQNISNQIISTHTQLQIGQQKDKGSQPTNISFYQQPTIHDHLPPQQHHPISPIKELHDPTMQSILLLRDQLETIDEISDDDSLDNVNINLFSSYGPAQPTMQCKVWETPKRIQGQENGFRKDHQNGQKRQQTVVHKILKLKTQSSRTNKNQLNHKQRPFHFPLESITSGTNQPTSNLAIFNHKPKPEQQFSNITLCVSSQRDTLQSISEALSVLKEYCRNGQHLSPQNHQGKSPLKDRKKTQQQTLAMEKKKKSHRQNKQNMPQLKPPQKGNKIKQIIARSNKQPPSGKQIYSKISSFFTEQK